MKKTFSVLNNEIRSYCEVIKGCYIEIIYSKNVFFSQIKWLVLKNDMLSESYSFSRELDQSKADLKDEFGFPLKNTEKVFVSLFKASGERKQTNRKRETKKNQIGDNLKFQIYP